MLFVFGTSFVQSLSTEIPFGKLEAMLIGGIVNKCLFNLFLKRNVYSLNFSTYENWQQR